MNKINSTITPEIASDVVSEMLKLDITVTAKTYHVWFGHRVGWYPEMTLEIDRLLNRGQAITEAFCDGMYAKHIATDTHAAALHEAEDAARHLIESVLSDVEGSCGATTKYHGELNQFVERLGDAASAGDVRTIVKGLIVQTSKMESASAQLKENLEQATDDIGKLRQELNQLEQESLTDPLTGLNNRKALDRNFNACFEAYESSGDLFCVMMLDVDHFKSFNDTYGHDVGDAVLRNVSTTLGDTGHPTATPHRYGGEEFCMLVGGCDLDEVIRLGDDIRGRISGRQLKIARTGEKIDAITISIGVAIVTKSDCADSLIQRADKALYLAKESGRNIVKCERDLTAGGVATNS